MAVWWNWFGQLPIC